MPRHGIRRRRGQSTVEFGVSAIVLILILFGLIDLGRAFYYDVGFLGATREAARHASWFDPAAARNPYLYDSAIQAAVDAALARSGLPSSQLQNPGLTCPSTADGNSVYNPPFSDGAYSGGGSNQPLLFICYDNTAGLDIPAPLTDNSMSGHDVNVILLMNFGFVAGYMQGVFGSAFHLVANTHMTIGGYPT